jgi:hypothetical protein
MRRAGTKVRTTVCAAAAIARNDCHFNDLPSVAIMLA